MRSIILLILLLLPTLLVAEEVQLYRGEATVVDNERAARQKALPVALENSVSKITGIRDLSAVPGLSEAMRRAANIVLTYYYRSRTILQADDAERDELRLVAEFAPQRVEEIIRELQLPVWQAERDPVEIWLIVDDAGRREILPQAWRYAWESMVHVAKDRGLPLIWPKPDDEGMYPVDQQLLWGGYTEDLVGNGGAGVMIIAARREGAVWNVRSNLQYRDETWAWRNQDYDLQQILTSTLHQAIDQVAATNAIAATDMGQWSYDLTVTGLGRAGDYQRCLKVLSEISVVDAVSVNRAQAGRFQFRLALNALPRYLEDALSASREFEFSDQPGEYRFIP